MPTISEHLITISTAVTGVATVVLAWYGRVQIREGQRERASRRGAAFDTLVAEASRLMRLSARWSQLDPIVLARKGQLVPDDLLPPDWGLIVSLLGQIGPETALLGSVAYGRLNDAVMHARDLVYAVGNRDRHLAQQVAHGLDSRTAESKWAEEAATVIAAIRGYLNEAAEGLWDAMLAGPKRPRRLAIPGDLKSRVAVEVRENAQALQQPPPPRRGLLAKLFPRWKN